MTKIHSILFEGPAIGTRIGTGENAILLDDEGFHYRGETIKDAGRAYKIFTEWFEMNPKNDR